MIKYKTLKKDKTTCKICPDTLPNASKNMKFIANPLLRT